MTTLKAVRVWVVLVVVAASVTACKSTLQTGGAYAPTNSVGQATALPDLAFYHVDAAFDVAYSAVDAAFKFEQDNRAMLWAISPKIKSGLDSIRPTAVQVVQTYGVARAAYLANPTPAGLASLQTWLAKAQQLAVSAGAAIANLPKTN